MRRNLLTYIPIALRTILWYTVLQKHCTGLYLEWDTCIHSSFISGETSASKFVKLFAVCLMIPDSFLYCFTLRTFIAFRFSCCCCHRRCYQMTDWLLRNLRVDHCFMLTYKDEGFESQHRLSGIFRQVGMSVSALLFWSWLWFRNNGGMFTLKCNICQVLHWMRQELKSFP